MVYLQKKFATKQQIKKYIREQFTNALGYELSFKDPKTFNEKLQWLKINYRDPLLTQCADKFAVRSYVESTIGKQYLVDLLGVYNDVEEVNFDALPNQFALKANNGSGNNIICANKKELDVNEAKDKIRTWLKPSSSHYYHSFEWCYKNIKPKIIHERYIEEFNKDLKDYKFLCFNGTVEMLFVCSERNTNLKVDFYDLNWNKLPFKRYYENSDKEIKKPNSFDLMVRLSERLAKLFPFVRVDLYESSERVLFGELTFYPGNGMEGFEPLEWDYKLGDMLKLPVNPKLSNFWSL